MELKLFLSNNVRMSTATEMCLRDHNSNNHTHSGDVCCCTYMVNNEYDKFKSFSRLYMTLFRHRTCWLILFHLSALPCVGSSSFICRLFHANIIRMEELTDFLVSVSNGQVAALGDRAYYQWALLRYETRRSNTSVV